MSARHDDRGARGARQQLLVELGSAGFVSEARAAFSEESERGDPEIFPWDLVDQMAHFGDAVLATRAVASRTATKPGRIALDGGPTLVLGALAAVAAFAALVFVLGEASHHVAQWLTPR